MFDVYTFWVEQWYDKVCFVYLFKCWQLWMAPYNVVESMYYIWNMKYKV